MRRPPSATESRSIATHPASPSTFRVAAEVHDSDTHEGLRTALAEIAVHGWDSEAGLAVLSSLRRRSAPWRSAWAQAGLIDAGAIDPGDVFSLAWLTLDKYACNVAKSLTPWAYLWTAVGKVMVVENAAATMLSERGVHRKRIHWPIGVDRLGGDDARVVRFAGMDGSLASREDRQGMSTSPAVAALVRHLAGSDPGEAGFWADAVDRAIDVMAGARRSYEELCLRRDVYMRVVLGLTRAELTALAALLIGTRKGDRAAQSLLLALHRDVDANPGDVDGAVDRIAFLTSRRRVADEALPVPVAA